ncbi:hypothetical protein DXG01_007173 [Tephrocybe rancida]|nr:hypothetical protein DXG01_007173 [Tephrocybe rancida]
MGVKSLWSLLTPVGRPVLLETVEGKIMAIDSSIWLYQFQATMRDKDGHALVNAHVMGFLRRISKLLYYGIKPVFVFDGGAPVLKKNTLRGRREKKSGAAASHIKVAEKLLAAQMRREALNQADSSTPKGKGKKAAPVIDDNTVYLEDIESTLNKTPARKKPPTPSSSSKKPKFYDHDPYRLPDVDLEAAVAKATRTSAPDPRLATEDELQAFIDEMRPEDFDVTSPAFRELPTEVQYEIVGDLRLKSRQTSYARLQKMLRNAPTPLDFSKQQIMNLKQRNTLTQQLLVTTDSIGSAHISIPVRIASERNKEYVLMKNEGESGGWILGIRDDGTKQKPIEIDQDEVVDKDSDEDMEEVSISVPAMADPDLREYQRSMALSAIGNRSGQRYSAPRPPIDRKDTRKPLFDLDDDDELFQELPLSRRADDDDDDMLAIAIQESLEHQSVQNNKPQYGPPPGEASSSKLPATPASTKRPLRTQSPGFNDDDFVFESPSRLETALTFANAGTSRPPLFPAQSQKNPTSIFGRPTLLSSSSYPDASTRAVGEIMPPAQSTTIMPRVVERAKLTATPESMEGLQETASRISLAPPPSHTPPPAQAMPESDSEDDDLEEVIPPSMEDKGQFTQTESEIPTSDEAATVTKDAEGVNAKLGAVPEANLMLDLNPLRGISAGPSFPPEDVPRSSPFPSNALDPSIEDVAANEDVPLFAPSPEDVDEEVIPWSRSPSPSHELPDTVASSRPRSPAHEDFDAAEEMDPHAEEGEYARFISQVKGKSIEAARQEIDDEIKFLNQQRKAAMRDSEDITQQMISQIMAMLRLFGIPYITAPMEAEAQCAELASLGLVDGVITDDSDVFLFGAQRVFKNMFNQSKTVECFLLTDLSRDLGLERDTLVRLAYLLGSDYTDGLPGVGPVVAMELLKEFPGEDGLIKFREWWLKVQSGKDKDEENKSKFRKQFVRITTIAPRHPLTGRFTQKKKFKSLFLTDDWPNPAVKDAYYNPTVDSSEEPFKWGLPDLDALRVFFHGELGWGQAKVDEILLPIIQKMNKRGQAAAMNKQSNLGEFFDMSAGSGTFAPKKRQAYTSKRLQNVVDAFRRKRGRIDSTESHSQSDNDEEPEAAHAKKRTKTATAGKARGGAATKAKTRGKAKPRGKTSRSKKLSSDDDNSDEIAPETTDQAVIPPDPVIVARLRPRPKPKRKEVQEPGVDEAGVEEGP